MNYSQSYARALSQASTPLDLDALFKPMSLDGIYARTGTYESVVSGLADFISTFREADMEILRFPPVMSRAHIERHGYLKSFPNLLGCVCGLHGTEQEIEQAAGRYYRGEDWTTSLAPNDLVLTPAACYPVYPIVAARGPVPDAGLRFDVAADCFRREPSRDIDRFQSFRMREYVCIGQPDQIVSFRERWIKIAQRIADQLGLSYRLDQASDPFFGRANQMVAIAQYQQALKFELLIPVRSAETPTACMSFNYHLDHFGKTWELLDSAGNPCHTGRVAFGMDRLAVALFAFHGTDLAEWPAAVRNKLGLD
ncbi:MAG: amino acid--[acyl-carrier-protein] ligase [Alphaproteobacteria bacterium]|nr:amino acid--[acyl-carrier-protein] ligase [Alphaproteobacteria bacterium]